MEIQSFDSIQFYRNFSKYDISGVLGKILTVKITPNWEALTKDLEKWPTKKQKIKILEDYVGRRDLDIPWRVVDGILTRNPILYKYPNDLLASLYRQKLNAIDVSTTEAREYADNFVIFFNKYDLWNLVMTQHWSETSDTESTIQD